MSFKSINELELYLINHSYIEGYSLSNNDIKTLSLLSGIPNRNNYPNIYRWSIHIIALIGLNNVNFNGTLTYSSSSSSNNSSNKKSTSTSASSAPVAKKADDDFDDLFGDDEPAKETTTAKKADDDCNDIFNYGEDDNETEEEKAANKARQARIAHALKLKEEKDAKEGKVKKEKAKPVEKSLVVLEVKPWEADTDLEMVWREILKYQQEGLTWGETFKLEPVAYGIKKLVLTCTIVDSLVVLDDITENIEALEQWVQSVNIAAMNKI